MSSSSEQERLQIYEFWRWQYLKRNSEYKLRYNDMTITYQDIGITPLFPSKKNPPTPETIGECWQCDHPIFPDVRMMLNNEVLDFVSAFSCFPSDPILGPKSDELLLKIIQSRLKSPNGEAHLDLTQYEIETPNYTGDGLYYLEIEPDLHTLKKTQSSPANIEEWLEINELTALEAKVIDERAKIFSGEVGSHEKWKNAVEQFLIKKIMAKPEIKQISNKGAEKRAYGLFLWDRCQHFKTCMKLNEEDAFQSSFEFLQQYEKEYDPSGMTFTKSQLRQVLKNTQECIKQREFLPVWNNT